MRISFISGVGSGHVGEHAFDLEIWQSGNLLDILNRSFYFICQIADSSHTGINSNQTENGFADLWQRPR